MSTYATSIDLENRPDVIFLSNEVTAITSLSLGNLWYFEDSETVLRPSISTESYPMKRGFCMRKTRIGTERTPDSLDLFVSTYPSVLTLKPGVSGIFETTLHLLRGRHKYSYESSPFLISASKIKDPSERMELIDDAVQDVISKSGGISSLYYAHQEENIVSTRIHMVQGIVSALRKASVTVLLTDKKVEELSSMSCSLNCWRLRQDTWQGIPFYQEQGDADFMTSREDLMISVESVSEAYVRLVETEDGYNERHGLTKQSYFIVQTVYINQSRDDKDTTEESSYSECDSGEMRTETHDRGPDEDAPHTQQELMDLLNNTSAIPADFLENLLDELPVDTYERVFEGEEEEQMYLEEKELNDLLGLSEKPVKQVHLVSPLPASFLLADPSIPRHAIRDAAMTTLKERSCLRFVLPPVYEGESYEEVEFPFEMISSLIRGIRTFSDLGLKDPGYRVDKIGILMSESPSRLEETFPDNYISPEVSGLCAKDLLERCSDPSSWTSEALSLQNALKRRFTILTTDQVANMEGTQIVTPLEGISI